LFSETFLTAYLISLIYVFSF